MATTAMAQGLVWSEEFNSGTRPDETVWSYDLGASGWGNNELQQYTDGPANARIDNGNLVIEVLEQASQVAAFSSARIRSEDKLTFQYGTVEARIKVPDLANGLWPAFWTLGSDFRDVGWPACGELDIMEMGSSGAISAGRVNRRVGSAAHWEHQGTKADFDLFYDAPSDLNGGFHTYTMEWTPESVSTYVDGTLIWTMDIDSESCADCAEFHQPHFIILNVAVGGNYTQIFNSNGVTASLPAEMHVDYIRIYDNGHTVLGGSAIEQGNPVIGPSHSGSWYNPDQSGHGFSMEFGTQSDGSPLAVIYWYSYDTQGNPIFMLGNGIPEGDRVEIDFISPVGMEFGIFDPATVSEEPGGTAVFEFMDQETGTFSFTPSDFSINHWGHSAIEFLPLVRLFGVPAPDHFPAPE